MVALKQAKVSNLEGGSLDQSLKPPLSKTEINLHRLLKSCERRVAGSDESTLGQDLRFANYVAVLRDLLNELQGGGVQNALSSISSTKAQAYETRIASLEKIVDEQTRQATSSRSEAGLESTSASNRRPPDGGEEAARRENLSSATNPAEPQLRHRSAKSQPAATTGFAGTKPTQSGGRLDQDVGRVLEQHRQLQEGLTDEMVELARAIKNNSLAMEQSMKETGKVLDATERAVEHSVATTSHVNTRAAKIYSATFRTGCFTWLVLLAVSAIFFAMVFLIRIT